MRKVFQRHLQPLNGRDYRIQGCQILSAYHHHHRCVLQYTLRLVELSTGNERSQLVGCVMHEGKAQQIWEQLQRPEPGREIPGPSPTFAPFSYVPDLGMLVQVFPYDHRLPTLPLFVAELPPELEPQLLAQFGTGDWKVEAWDIEPVRWLVGMRATLRITTRAQDSVTGRVQEKRFYAKVYGEETGGEQTYQVLRALWDKVSAGGVDITVGKPIAYLSDLRTLIQEEVSGIPRLDTFFQKDLADPFLQKEEVIHELIPVMRKVARALASLHLARVAISRRHSPRDTLLFLKETEKRLLKNCPRLRPKVEEIVSAVATGLEEAPAAPSHGDFKPDHIFVDGDRLALIDFDDFAEADPVRDVTRMLATMGRAVRPRLPVSHDRVRAVQQAFVEEYFAQVPAAWRARLPFHYAKDMLKVVSSVVLRHAPGWSDEVEALIEEARASLAGRIW